MWSWILGSLGVIALFSIGKYRWWGWYLALVNECLWFTYGIVTKQYGFCFAAVAYGIVNFKNGWKWFKDHFHKDKQNEPI